MDKLVTFPTRKLWAEHEFKEHRVIRVWQCYECSVILHSPEEWKLHRQAQHCEDLSGLRLQKALDVAELRHPALVAEQKCPLCLEVPGLGQRAFATHVGRHMEEIALAALPRDAEDDSDESPDVSRSSKGSSKAFISDTRVSLDTAKRAREEQSCGGAMAENDGYSVSASEHPVKLKAWPPHLTDPAYEVNEGIETGPMVKSEEEHDGEQEQEDETLRKLIEEGAVLEWQQKERERFEEEKREKEKQEKEKQEKEKQGKEKPELEYKERLRKDFGLTETQGAKEIDDALDLQRATHTKIARRHISLETLRVYDLPYRLDDVSSTLIAQLSLISPR